MISFFAQYNNRLVQLPVNPEKITIKGSADNSTTKMVNQGELNDIGFNKLKELTIDSFFPYNSGALYINTNESFEKPQFYINLFEEIKNNRSPFRLIITELNINMLVSIESFEITYQFGTDDVDYNLSLKEYREHKVKKLTIISSTSTAQTVTQATSTSNNNRSTEIVIPTTYTIISGDTLWSISKRLLGDGSRWNEIYTYNNNKSIIGGNPNLIKPGQVITIPK